MATYRETTLDRYLLDAATLAEGRGEQLWCKPDRNITVAEMQAALNAQYGNVFKVGSHGSSRYIYRYSRAFDGVWDGSPEVNTCEEYADGSRVHPKGTIPSWERK
ncbi:MAG: hypothetical protein JO256_14110 [Alphaproteobacteria bacterium]|nr:hypothetical protein [Alphaproteobacteria bacterium]